MPSITRTLQVSVAAASTLVVLAGGLATFYLSAATLHRLADDALVARANAFAAMVVEEEPDIHEDDAGGLELDYKGSLEASDLGVFVRITAADGSVIGMSRGFPPVRWNAPGVRAHKGGLLAHATLADGASARVARVREPARAELAPPDRGRGVDPPDTTVPSDLRVTVEVATPTAAVDAATRAVLVAAVLGAVLAAIGCTLAATLAIARGLRPIADLSRAVDRVDAANPAPLERAAEPPAELAPIGDAIDAMLARIAATSARERRFTDAAAHELRTPLAELRSVCDVATAYPDRVRRARAVEQASAICLEMTALLESLLAAARGEPVPAEMLRAVALFPIIATALERAAERLKANDIRVTVTVPPGAAWRATPAAARMIIANLVDNATAYTPPGGAITVSAVGDERGWTLTITNGPVDLDPGAAASTFEPFWRADASRSDSEHRGLGLSVVAAQAASLGLVVNASVTDASAFMVVVSPAAT